MALDFYIGAEVEHESERALLSEIDRVWASTAQQAIVLVNINLSGRQIDAVAVDKDLVLVLEAKHYSRAVQGTTNGPWQARMASGKWKECKNAYGQVLGEKNALCDAMRRFDVSADGFYPDAAVVLVPEIPRESKLTEGDFKASIIGLDGLKPKLVEIGRNCWTLKKWREFAAHHGLRKVSSLSTVLSVDLQRAESRLSEYIQNFSDTYAATADEFLETPWPPGGVSCSLESVVNRLTRERGNVLVTGPSGCGKTLFGTKSAISVLKCDGVPIYIRAHEFEGKLKDLLSREAGLLSASPVDILNAARRLERPLYLILDGYNECRPERQAMLIRAVAALSRRYAATLLITSQIPLAHPELIEAEEVSVPLPSMELKRAIASRAMEDRPYLPELDEILESVTSGLEARLVGTVSARIGSGASRFAIFDTFVRDRLGDVARDGVSALTLVAGWLTENHTFSISNRDLERFLLGRSESSAVVPALLSKNLLIRRGDRTMFSHELFLNAFAAESVVRRSGDDAESILSAIHSPIYADAGSLIVGAIDNHDLLIRVLERVTNSTLLAHCRSGLCGRAAREWIEARLPCLFTKMRAEIHGLRFRLAESGWSRVEIDASPDVVWTASERALLACMPDLVASGVTLNAILQLVGEMDAVMAGEAERLREIAKAAKIRLRSEMFAAAYVAQRPDAPGISQVCWRLHGGLYRRAASAALITHMKAAVTRGAVTPGQMNVLTLLSRSVEASNEAAATFVVWGLTTYWPKAPSHLRISLVDAAGPRREATARQKSDLIAALESLLSNDTPLLNTCIFESLQQLGASESMEAEHIDSVRRQLMDVVIRRDDESAWGEAHGLYNCQFDHPYSNAYCEAIQELPQEQRDAFTVMAAKGARDSFFFFGLLLRDVYKIGGKAACEVLSRWTAIPPIDSVSPQESIETYVIANQFLGRLRGELPGREYRSAQGAAAVALRACGELLYWSNRTDLSVEERRSRSSASWGDLGEPHRGAAIVAVHMCTDWHMMVQSEDPTIETIPSFFVAECTTLCRWSLENPKEQVDYFRHFGRPFGRGALDFAVKVLGEYGNTIDLNLLRSWSVDPELGRGAMGAIRALERRVLAN